jgi:hypothetical protein
MLGFNPISSLPISTIYPLFVPAGPVGGAPNYQYPGEASISADGINALFDTQGRADARRKRLDETRRAMGLLPSVESPPAPIAPVPIAPAFDDALYAKVLRDEQARQDAAKAADAVIQVLRTQATLAVARAERIRQDDGDVLMMLAEML